MEAKVIWLFVFVAVYWSYCLFWGVKGAISSRTASDYFVAGRGLSLWVFVLAATATSFSGWTFMGHPASIYTDGFQYAYASFYAITIPFTGVLFLKRQWVIGKRFGFITPGEMLSYYFRSDVIRLLVIVVALVFSVPYLGVQLRASGFLFNVLTDGMFDVNVGMVVLSAVVAIYVASGGLRAVAYVDTMQAILLALGIVIIGVIAMNAVGGWNELTQSLAAYTQLETANMTPSGDPSYIAIPGVIQFVSDGPSAQGGAWTGIMVLTYMFALMGIQSSPAFSMWAFSNKSPDPFAPQQVWASSFGIGIILFVFTAMQGVGTHFMGADLDFARERPELVSTEAGPKVQGSLIEVNNREAFEAAGLIQSDARTIASDGLALLGSLGEVPTFQQVADGGNAAAASIIQATPDMAGQPALIDIRDGTGSQGALVPQLINLMGDSAPWLVGLLSVCALAAMQSTGAAYMSTAGGMLTRDLLRHFLIPNASHNVQKLSGRIGVVIIVVLALIVAVTATDALVLLGGLAVAYGFQMWPALIAVCYWPFLTRQGVTLGLIAGLAAVTLTESIGQQWFGIEAWGRWPLTIHSAGWGIIFNLGIAILVSLVTRDDIERKMEFHNFLAEHCSLPPEKRSWVPAAWIITLLWFIFAIGPGAVLGNWVFGDPNDASTWLFGIPSIWTWQLLFWALGVMMMFFLAYIMEMSTSPETAIDILAEDVAEIEQRA